MKKFIFFLLSFMLLKNFAQQINYDSLHSQYDYVGCYDDNGLAKVGTKSYCGLMDKKGNTIIPFIYDNINVFTKDYYLLEKNKLMGICDTSYKIIIPVEYQYIKEFNNKYFEAMKNDKYGLIDINNQIILAFEYDKIEGLNGNLIFAKKENTHIIFNKNMQKLNEYICQDIEGIDIYQNQYDFTKKYKNLYNILKINNKVGVIDTNAKILIPCEYDDIKLIIENNLFYAEKEDKKIILSHTGEVLFNKNHEDIEYDYVNHTLVLTDSSQKIQLYKHETQSSEFIHANSMEVCSKDIYILTIDSAYWKKVKFDKLVTDIQHNAININICNPKTNSIDYMQSSITQFFLYNHKTHSILAQYQNIEKHTLFDTTILLVKQYDKYGILNIYGEVIVPIIYDYIDVLTKDYIDYNIKKLVGFDILLNDKHGLINIAKEEILACKYDKIENIQELVFAIKNNKCILLKNNKIIYLEVPFEDLLIKKNNRLVNLSKLFYMPIKQNGYIGLLGENGKILIPAIYDYIMPINDYLYLVEKNNQYAIFDKNGMDISGFVYNYSIDYTKEPYITCKKSNKMGVIDSLGKTIIPFIYDKIEIETKDKTKEYYAIVYQADSIMYVNMNYQVISAPYYENEITYQKNKGYGYCDKNQVEIIPFQYNTHYGVNIHFNYHQQIVLKSISKLGLVNQKNKIILPVEYNNIAKNNEYYILNKNNQYGLSDSTGKILLACEYDYIEYVYTGFTLNKKGKYGFYIPQKNIKTDCVYADNTFFYRANIQKIGNLYGVINDSNKVCIPFIYEYIRRIGGDFYFAEKESQFYLIHFTKGVIQKSTKKFQYYKNNYALHILKNNQILCYNNQGEKIGENVYVKDSYNNDTYYHIHTINQAIFSDKIYLSESLEKRLLYAKNKETIMDIYGKYLFEPIYDELKNSKDGYLVGKIKDKFYKLTVNGKIIIPEEYEIHTSFRQGLIAVSKNSKWGFVDEKSNIKIPLLYDLVSDFYKTYSIVYQQGKCGIIDTNGNIVIPIIYEGIEILDNTYFKVKKDCKFGMVDKNNIIRLPLIYDFMEKLYIYNLPLVKPIVNQTNINSYGYNYILLDKKYQYEKEHKHYYENFIVMQNNLYGLVDTNNHILIPIEYKILKRYNNDYFIGENKKGQTVIFNNEYKIIIEGNNIRINYANKISIEYSTNDRNNIYYNIKNNKKLIENYDRIIEESIEGITYKKMGKLYFIDNNGIVSEIHCED